MLLQTVPVQEDRETILLAVARAEEAMHRRVDTQAAATLEVSAHVHS
jgi:hypothetical protein